MSYRVRGMNRPFLTGRRLTASRLSVGWRITFRLYDAFNDSTIDGRTCAAVTDRVMRGTIDMSLAELEAALAGG